MKINMLRLAELDSILEISAIARMFIVALSVIYTITKNLLYRNSFQEFRIFLLLGKVRHSFSDKSFSHSDWWKSCCSNKMKKSGTSSWE